MLCDEGKRAGTARGEAYESRFAGRLTGRGFTLIELLVVVAIVAVLMSILLPSLAAARDQAKTVQCMAHLQQFGRGFHAYGTDNRDYLCSGQSWGKVGYNYPTYVTDRDQIGIHKVGWIADLVNNKLGYPGKMLCPSNPGRQTKNLNPDRVPPGHLDEDYYRYLMEHHYNTNYCQSWFMIHTGPNLSSGLVDKDAVWANLPGGQLRMDMGPLRTAKLIKASPGTVPLLGDARTDGEDWEVFEEFGEYKRVTKAATDGPGYFYDEQNRRYGVVYRRATPFASQRYEDFGAAHGRGGFFNINQHTFTRGNLLFADGHVRTFEDKYRADADVKEGPADGELDSWDLEGMVFDGVLDLGRRSESVAELQ